MINFPINVVNCIYVYIFAYYDSLRCEINLYTLKSLVTCICEALFVSDDVIDSRDLAC